MDDPKPQPNQPAERPSDLVRTYDNEPETYVTSSGLPVTPAVSQQQSQMVIPKKKSSAMKWLFRGFVVLLLAGLAAFSYWQWSEADSARTELKSINEQYAALKSASKTVDTTATNEDPAAGKGFIAQTQITVAALNTVEAYMSTRGASRLQYEASVPYLDEDFARVQVDYMEAKNKPTGKGEVFFFKRIPKNEETGKEESWAMIAINPMTAEEIASLKSRYGVTDEVIDGEKPA